MAGLIRRKPQLTPGNLMKLKDAAAILGCDHETIRRGTVGNFKLYRLGTGKTSPLYVLRADVERFLEKVLSA